MLLMAIAGRTRIRGAGCFGVGAAGVPGECVRDGVLARVRERVPTRA